ncbi:hypothetical protein MTP99_001727 [Tenebrio molitor]|nr:hypothetical protein MTP99_001727 [Tenebrio molitor]
MRTIRRRNRGREKYYQRNGYASEEMERLGAKGGSSVAAWLSETVLRGRGPGATGFESHRRGGFFRRKEPPPGHGCLSGADVTMVEGRATSAGFESQAGWASHGCCVLLYSCCVVQKKEKREGGRG